MRPVRTRHVFFLSGFDPKGAAYYHRLYREQAAAQGQVSGTPYAVGPRTRLANGNAQWQVLSGEAAQRTETRYEFVQWDDIVRAHWPRTAWQVLAGSLRGYAAALASPAALRKVRSASPRTLVALAYPAMYWLLAAVLGLVAGWLVATGFRPGGWPAGLAGALTAVGIGWAALRWERHLNTSWLLRIYQFAADWRGGRTPQLQQRMDRTAADVLRVLGDPQVDEVLLVGFSVGSLLAVSVAARVQQAAAARVPLDRLSLLTLGHCIPLLGLMKGADAFRAELASLGGPPQVRWTDFSAPTDWGSFALVDPLAITLGPAGADRPYAPRMASPRFHTMFPPDVYALLARDKRRIHMQYLMAGQLPAAYDYFAITAGPARLEDRLPSPASP